MKITLDNRAVTQLIANDPEFELQLKTAVLAEIGKKSVGSNMQKLIEESGGPMFRAALAELAKEEAIDEAIKKGIGDRISKYKYNIRNQQITDPLHPADTITVDEAIQRGVDKCMNQMIAKAITARDQLFEDKINDRFSDKLIEAKLEQAIDKAIAKRADAIIAERFADWFNANVADLISRAQVSLGDD